MPTGLKETIKKHSDNDVQDKGGASKKLMPMINNHTYSDKKLSEICVLGEVKSSDLLKNMYEFIVA